nr:hypothetical protein [uncultured Ruminococcus sp.]
MILAIITAVVCFAAAIIMLTPYFRKITLLRPMAFFLIFQGAWHIFSYLICDIYPTSQIPGYVNRIGTILIILYYIFILFMTRSTSKRKKRDKKS